jgi:hypothetical protein
MARGRSPSASVSRMADWEPHWASRMAPQKSAVGGAPPPFDRLCSPASMYPDFVWLMYPCHSWLGAATVLCTLPVHLVDQRAASDRSPCTRQTRA